MNQTTTPKRTLSCWWSPLVLVASGAFLAVRWEAIPERWIVHWGLGGVPNGWATRTLLGVYAPLIGGGVLWLLMEGLAAIARARGQREPALAALEDANTRMLRVVSLAISLVFGLLAVVLPLGPHVGPGAITLLALGLVLGSVFIGASMVSRALDRARREGHAERLKGYRGLYYSNPEDRRLWVPKLSGLGTTINFANPWAWPAMILITVLPVVLVLVQVAYSR